MRSTPFDFPGLIILALLKQNRTISSTNTLRTHTHLHALVRPEFGSPSQPEHVELSPPHTPHRSFMLFPITTPRQSRGTCTERKSDGRKDYDQTYVCVCVFVCVYVCQMGASVTARTMIRQGFACLPTQICKHVTETRKS